MISGRRHSAHTIAVATPTLSDSAHGLPYDGMVIRLSHIAMRVSESPCDSLPNKIIPGEGRDPRYMFLPSRTVPVTGKAGCDAFKPEISVNGFLMMDFYAGQRSHAGLHHFRVKSIDTLFAAKDIADPKPVCCSDNCTQVARIADIVEKQAPVD